MAIETGSSPDEHAALQARSAWGACPRRPGAPAGRQGLLEELELARLPEDPARALP